MYREQNGEYAHWYYGVKGNNVSQEFPVLFFGDQTQPLICFLTSSSTSWLRGPCAVILSLLFSSLTYLNLVPAPTNANERGLIRKSMLRRSLPATVIMAVDSIAKMVSIKTAIPSKMRWNERANRVEKKLIRKRGTRTWNYHSCLEKTERWISTYSQCELTQIILKTTKFLNLDISRSFWNQCDRLIMSWRTQLIKKEYKK